MITSLDDPQLNRCLDSVHNQTVPFSNVVRVHNVCPADKAFSDALGKTVEEWVMYLGSDMILDLDALEKIIQFIKRSADDKVIGYFFGLWDTFLDCRIGYVGVLKASVYKLEKISGNHAGWDGELHRRLKRKGWKASMNFRFLVGTHFDRPDEYQVFRRFYLHGVRFNHRKPIQEKLAFLLNDTGNHLYQVALDALNYATVKNFYPGSHNLEFDRDNYESFSRHSHS